mmetsp:Transcript_14361/g.28682  ORF Transcript_14361/g.28682 Transcript_14361/m.28682 type:complete len:591 (-) Transcript_14361:142-1914(-)
MRIIILLFSSVLFSNGIISLCLAQASTPCWREKVTNKDGKRPVCPDDCRPYVTKKPEKTYCKFRSGKKPRCKCPWPKKGCENSEPVCKFRNKEGQPKKFKCRCQKPITCNPKTELKTCVAVFGGLFLKCTCEEIPSEEPSDMLSEVPSNSPSDAPRASVMMHVMPWFSTEKDEDYHWAMYLAKKDDLYLMDRYKRNGTIASYYTPLIGPYDSSDPVTIRLQLDLMKQAGVDGIILNWYGITDRLDYLTNKIGSDAIIKEVSAAGMSWTICYEDSTIDKKKTAEAQNDQLRDDWLYIRDEYIKKFPGVLRDKNGSGRPIFYVFGPRQFKSLTVWTTMLSSIFLTDRPILQGVNPANKEFMPDGIFLWPGPPLLPNVTKREQVTSYNNNFYETAATNAWFPVTGGVYTRFRDYYSEGKKPGRVDEDTWNNNVQDLGGETLDECMVNAKIGNADVIQIITWNDWQEGTSFEPSYEEGFTQLLRLQENLLGRRDEGAMLDAVKRYNKDKAQDWGHYCDNDDKEARDCGYPGSNKKECDAKGCCWRQYEAKLLSNGDGNKLPMCFHRSEKFVCNCANDIRDCEAKPQDRLCCCKH